MEESQRNYWFHVKAFRKEGHKYYNYTDHERFLDYKWGKFSFEW